MRDPNGWLSRIALAGLALSVLPTLARADGAFPDSEIILTPDERPGEIILVTNFGLIQTQDGGATWLWSCEQTANAFGAFYQAALPPRHRLYTLANQQVMYSDDRGCGWTATTGLVPAAVAGVSDVWVDRTVPDRVLAVDIDCCAADRPRTHVVFEATDGAGFTKRIFQAELGAMITGVESARSDPKVIYVTLQGAPPPAGGWPPPLLARTADGGLTWQSHDLGAQLGQGGLRLVAIDPVDPGKAYLLWNGVDGQALVFTGDGGLTASKVLVPSGVVKAFLRLRSGTVLASTEDKTVAGLYRSKDGGQTFEPLPHPPHVRALSEREGVVYAATDNFAEGYAVATSTDEGLTWNSLLAYQDVRGIIPCLKAACQSSCEAQVVQLLWSADVCSADVVLPGSGGTTVGTGGHGGGSAGGAAGGSGIGNGSSNGCGCHARPSGAPAEAGTLFLALLALAFPLRRPRRTIRR